jgi:hypothetical protein
MASGILGQADLSATTNTLIYTVGANTAAVTISAVNRNTSNSVYLSVAVGTISNTSAPANSNYIEYNAVLNPYQVLERTGIVLSNGQKVVVYSNAALVAVSVFGIEN